MASEDQRAVQFSTATADRQSSCAPHQNNNKKFSFLHLVYFININKGKLYLVGSRGRAPVRVIFLYNFSVFIHFFVCAFLVWQTTMEKTEFRILIKHCYLMGKNTVQTKKWLDKCYPDAAPSRQMVERWIAEFKRGRTNTDDAERSGRPNSVVVPGTIEKVRKLVQADRKLKLREIAQLLKIAQGSVFTILHEHLSMQKLCSKWVPRFLTADQKQQRFDDSEQCLALFERDQIDFFHRYVTMDETWIHHYNTNESAADKQQSKRSKSQLSDGKVLATVFWDVHGILLIDYYEEKTGTTTIDSEYYGSLLVQLKEEIGHKRSEMCEKKVLLHQNNLLPCHKSLDLVEKLRELRFELLPHSTYSPDLTPSDYYLFADLKRVLQGKRFGSNKEVIAETEAYFEAKDASFYRKGIEMLEKRWSECIRLKGDYVSE